MTELAARRRVSEAFRRLNDLVEAVEETPGPPSGIALDGVYALARAYGEALASVVGQLTGKRAEQSTKRVVVVHEIRPGANGGRGLRVTAELVERRTERGGRAELAALEDTMPLLQLPRPGRGSAGVVDTVRKAVRAAAPALSNVTVVLKAAPGRTGDRPQTLRARPRASAVRF